MKITDMKIYRVRSKPPEEPWLYRDYHLAPLMFYKEYTGKRIPIKESVNLGTRDPAVNEHLMLEIQTDEDISGIVTPCDQIYQAELALSFKELLIGKDPMAVRTIWDMMKHYDTRSHSGLMTNALAAIDNCLWDLRGKICGQPSYKMMGGGRDAVPVYFSTTGTRLDDPENVRAVASMLKEKGIKGQKWYFKYGPSDGFEGMHKNSELAHTVREAVGDDYMIMFDVCGSWNVGYSLDMFRELEAVHPFWIEEPLRDYQPEAYRFLRSKVNIPISMGERFYNRYELHEFLKVGAADIYQPEPEQAGGMSEMLYMADMCAMYGSRCILHGLSLLLNMTVTASVSPETMPFMEWLGFKVPGAIAMLKNPPKLVDGCLAMPQEPGMFHLDSEKILSVEEIKI